MSLPDNSPKPEVRERKEKTPELKLADYIWSQVEQALVLQLADIEAKKEPLKFHQYLARVWNGETIGDGLEFHLPKKQFSGIFLKATLFFNKCRDIKGDAASALSTETGCDFEMIVQTGALNHSRGDEREQVIRQMKMNIYHEVQHFYTDGSTPDLYEQDLNGKIDRSKDSEDEALKRFVAEVVKQEKSDPKYIARLAMVLYLSDPGEITAYASQFASVYVKDFPNQAFTADKLEDTATKSVRSGVWAKHYVKLFGDLTIQSRYDFGVQEYHGTTLTEVRTSFINQITDFIEQLREI